MDPRDPPRPLDDALRDPSLYHRAPAHLRERIRDGIRHQTEPATPLRRPFAWGIATAGNIRAWIAGGVAGLVVCALILGTVALLPKPAPIGTLASDIVSSHVRALLSQHPIDVISTDEHTVKPWFNGKLDYAPPVVDLAAQGFPLVGGRIDYVDHRVVAVLVYRYQKHPIDLYVFPDNGRSGSPGAWTKDGYALAHWRADGMAYWAITDAEPAHLRTFQLAIQAARQ